MMLSTECSAKSLAVQSRYIYMRDSLVSSVCQKNHSKVGYQVVHSSSNGYVLNILPYTGAESLQDANVAYASLPQPAQVVMHLIESYLNKGHHLFTDRYYTSVPLA